MIVEKIYKGRDNIISLGLIADGALVDISGLNRVTLQVGELLVDSAVHSGALDWTTNGANGQLDVDIADISGLENGQFKARLIIYDATYPNGLVWDEFQLFVYRG
jgi:hypothetical protein